ATSTAAAASNAQSAANAARGPATPRVDGRAKVCGEAMFASDFAPPGLTWAFLKTSSIACGRIIAIDERPARAVPGVLEILTHHNVGERVQAGEISQQQGHMGSSIAPLQSERVRHSGQIVAVVVADSFEAAREAAFRLEVRYEAQQPAASFDDAGVTITPAHPEGPHSEEPRVGAFDSAYAHAAVKTDACY